jgi:hypothetical protein
MKLPTDAGDESRSVPVEHELRVLSAQTHFDWRTGAIGNKVPSAASFVSSVAQGDRVVALPLATSSVVQAHILRSGHDDLVKLHQLLHVDTATAVTAAAAAGGTPAGPLAAAATAFADFNVRTSLHQARALGAFAVFCASKSALNAVQALEDSTDGFGEDDGNGGDGDAPAHPAALRSHLRDMRMLLAISTTNEKYAALHDIVGERLRLALLPPTPAEYVKLLQRDETSIVIPDGYLEGNYCPEILDRAMNPPPVWRAAAAAHGGSRHSATVTALFAVLVAGDGTSLANDAAGALRLLRSQSGNVRHEVAALRAIVKGADPTGKALRAVDQADEELAGVTATSYVTSMAASENHTLQMPRPTDRGSSGSKSHLMTFAAKLCALPRDRVRRATDPPAGLRRGVAAAAAAGHGGSRHSFAVTALFAVLVAGDGTSLANDAAGALRLLRSQSGDVSHEIAALRAIVTAADGTREALRAVDQADADIMRKRKASKPVTPTAALPLLLGRDEQSLAGGITGVCTEAPAALFRDKHLFLLLQRSCAARWPDEGELESRSACHISKRKASKKDTKAMAGMVEVACALAGSRGTLAERVVSIVPVLMHAAPGAFPSQRHEEAFGHMLGAATTAADDEDTAAVEAARVQWRAEWANRSSEAAAASGGRRRSARGPITPAAPEKKRPAASVPPKEQAKAKTKRLKVCTAAALPPAPTAMPATAHHRTCFLYNTRSPPLALVLVLVKKSTCEHQWW